MSPARPLRPCVKNGCPQLVPSGYCKAHEPERYKAKDPEQAKFYGSVQWKAIRKSVKSREPICRMCQRKPTQIVDHIDNNWRNNDPSNHQGLCRDCNATKTSEQHRRKRG